MLRVCSRPGCGTLVEQGARGGRCPTCARAAARARGTTTELGWGWDHQKARAEIQARIDAGETVCCWSCDVQLVRRAWHLDHTDDRQGYRGPACAHCNLSLAGKKSARGLDPGAASLRAPFYMGVVEVPRTRYDRSTSTGRV
jgi:hypothetical protein